MSINEKIKRSLKFLPDKVYIQLYYFLKIGRVCNFKKPKSYTEKLQWLKLNDHNELYPNLIDKYTVKKLVADKIGEEFIIPTLGLWEEFDDIDFTELPNQFVLKCTHDSGGVVICKDKNNFDFDSAKKIINTSLNNNFYWQAREWPYAKIKPRIIAEEYIESKSGELDDYKFFCFNGKPKYLLVATNRNNEDHITNFDYFDIDFNHLPINRSDYPNSEIKLQPPKNFDLMKKIAGILCKDLIHVRVDLYNVSGHPYFGELTFYNGGGFSKFEPNSWDYEFGKQLDLPSIEELNKKRHDNYEL